MACEQGRGSFIRFRMISSVTSQPCYCVCLFFVTAFTSTNCTRVSHKTNATACRNSTVSPELSRLTSLSRWTWAGGPLALHSWSETTLTHKTAFLGISMHLFQKQYYKYVRNAVLAVCGKPVPVWGKTGEMRGLLRREKLSWHVLLQSLSYKECSVIHYTCIVYSNSGYICHYGPNSLLLHCDDIGNRSITFLT